MTEEEKINIKEQFNYIVNFRTIKKNYSMLVRFEIID